MPSARMLDDSALEAHCQMLATQAPDVHANLRHPGLPEEEIKVQFAGAGIRPSDEVIRWWSFWGCAPKSQRKSLGFNLDVLPDCAFVTVQDSVEAHAFNRGLAQENASPGRPTDELWHPQWVPLYWFDNGFVTADCRGPAEEPSPLMKLTWWSSGDSDYGTPFSPSLGEFLIRGTEWLKRQQLRFEPARRLWWPLDAYHMKWPTVLGLPPVV
jgi:hypothetical protein